jgi:hypothetical protein
LVEQLAIEVEMEVIEEDQRQEDCSQTPAKRAAK